MRFFRRDRLFVPAAPDEVTEKPKGRSMVGYSRRAFLWSAAALVTAPSIVDQFDFVCGPTPPLGEIPMGPTLAQTFENFADAAGFRMVQIGDTFDFKTAVPFQVGQTLEFAYGAEKPALLRVTESIFSSRSDREVMIQISSEVIGESFLAIRKSAWKVTDDR